MPWHHDQAHNHGTWSCAAVGLLGYALKDTVLIHRALYGTRLDRKGGFFFQIDNLFSPDGYYTEGPYYFRYAIWPFYWLAQAVENNQPSLRILMESVPILIIGSMASTRPGRSLIPRLSTT